MFINNFRQISRFQLNRNFKWVRNSSFNFQYFKPDQGYYCQSPYEKINISNCLIHEHVWENIGNWPDKDAIVCGVTGRKFTYAKLRDACAILATKLRTVYNLTSDDVVAICLPNIPEFAIALLGALEAGIIVTTINPKCTIDEISQQILKSNPKLIFSLLKDYETLAKVQKHLKKSLHIVSVKMISEEAIPSTAINFHELIQQLDHSKTLIQNIDPSSVCLLPYSSGSTGLPKGVLLTHRNLVTNCLLLNAKLPHERLILPTTSTYQDVLLCLLPFFHMYGLMVTLLSKLSVGCKLVTLPAFNLHNLLSCVVEHRATVLHLVPHIMVLWAQHSNVQIERIEYIRTIMSAASSLGALDYIRFRDKYPKIELLQGYGLTETAGLATVTPKYCKNYASIGCPTSSTEAKIIKIDDSNHIGLDVNEIGELLVRGPIVMHGYLNNEAATNEIFSKDGWLRTGDLAFYDKDGHFYIKGRLKELIKVKGFQVAPAELEEILRNHPKVLDAVVVGVPHSINGEVPKAFVIKTTEAQVTEDELLKYVATKVVDYKKLEGGIKFVDFIPKTESGKPLRRLLK